MHGGRLYDSNPIATNYFSEALGGLVVFVNPKVDFWGPLINEADCLKSSGSLVGVKNVVTWYLLFRHFVRNIAIIQCMQ